MPRDEIIDSPLISAEGAWICWFDGVYGGMGMIVLFSCFWSVELAFQKGLNIGAVIMAIS